MQCLARLQHALHALQHAAWLVLPHVLDDKVFTEQKVPLFRTLVQTSLCTGIVLTILHVASNSNLLVGRDHCFSANPQRLYYIDADLLLLQVTNETLVTIFQTILSWHLETGGFPDSCRKLGPGIIAATLDMYSQSMAKLLPTPTKSHYTFNLRDFARVIQVLQSACIGLCYRPTVESFPFLNISCTACMAGCR